MEIENIEIKEIINRNSEYDRKAKEYMHSILYGVESFKRHGQRPVIVMSQDIFGILRVFTQNAIKLTNINENTCCECPVKIAFGQNVLLVALDLQPMQKGGE